MLPIHNDIIAKVSSFINVLMNLNKDERNKNVYPTFAKDYNNLRNIFIKYYPGKVEFVPSEILITDTSGLTQVFANYSEILTYAEQIKNLLDVIELESM